MLTAYFGKVKYNLSCDVENFLKTQLCMYIYVVQETSDGQRRRFSGRSDHDHQRRSSRTKILRGGRTQGFHRLAATMQRVPGKVILQENRAIGLLTSLQAID